MKYRLIHPNAETTEHPRLLFLQEYNGHLNALYEHVSVTRGVTRLWLRSATYMVLIEELDPELTIYDMGSCETGRAMQVTQDMINEMSGNLIEPKQLMAKVDNSEVW